MFYYLRDSKYGSVESRDGRVLGETNMGAGATFGFRFVKASSVRMGGKLHLALSVDDAVIWTCSYVI